MKILIYNQAKDVIISDKQKRPFGEDLFEKLNIKFLKVVRLLIGESLYLNPLSIQGYQTVYKKTRYQINE